MSSSRAVLLDMSSRVVSLDMSSRVVSLHIPVGMLYIVGNNFDDLSEGSKRLGSGLEEAGEVEDHLAVVRRAPTRHCIITQLTCVIFVLPYQQLRQYLCFCTKQNLGCVGGRM